MVTVLNRLELVASVLASLASGFPLGFWLVLTLGSSYSRTSTPPEQLALLTLVGGVAIVAPALGGVLHVLPGQPLGLALLWVSSVLLALAGVALFSFYGFGILLAPGLVLATLAALAGTVRQFRRKGNPEYRPLEAKSTRHQFNALAQRVGVVAVFISGSIATAAAESYAVGRLVGAFGGGIRVEVPAGYRGDLVLETDQSSCPSLMHDGGTIVVSFATNGRTCTSDGYPSGFNSYDFVAVGADGSRLKLPSAFAQLGGQSTTRSDYGEYKAHVGRVGVEGAQQTTTHPLQILELNASPLGIAVRGDPTYPATTYPVLRPDGIEARQQAFLSQNDTSWDVSIDPFGYVESLCADDPNTPAPTKDVVEIRPLVTDQDVSFWTSVVRRNAAFFGVDTPDNFGFTAVDQPVDVGGRTILTGRIATVQQQFAGYNALQRWERPWLWSYEDPMILFKVANKATGRVSICLTGHLWPGVVLPAHPSVSAEEVQQALLDYNGSSIVNTGQSSVMTAPVLVLNGQRLELRLATLGSLRPPRGGHWIIDAVTGENLASMARK